MSAKYKSPSFLLPNELNTSANPANDTGINSLYSMDFSGSGDKIQTGLTPPLGDSSRSISLWFYTSNSLSRNICGYGAASQVSGHNGFDILTYTGNYVGIHLFGTAVIAGGTYNLNAWNHYVITYDGTTLQGYLNGVAVDSNNTEVVNTLSTNNFIIGEGVYTNFNAFSGKIDEVAIFNRALNTTEIAALYGGTSPNIYPSNLMAADLNPVAYYPLGEQAQNSGKLPDATGSEWQFPNGVLQDYVMDFDSTSPGDYVSLGDLTTVESSEFTISMWVNKDNIATNSVLFNSGTAAAPNNSVTFQHTGSTFYIAVGGAGAQTLNPGLSSGVWYNFILTVNGTTAKLYIDGSQFGSNITVGSVRTGIGSEAVLGKYNFGTYANLDGKMSNVAIWNSDQSANIADIYNNGSPQITYTVSPQNWWKLNSTSVYTPSAPNYTTALDFVPNDYINCGNDSSLNIYNNITISAWIKADLFGAYNLIIGRSTNKDYDFGTASYGGNNILRFHTGDGTQEYVDSSGISLVTGQWYQVAVVRTTTPNQVTFFVNGQQLNTVSLTRTPVGSTDITRIGSRSGSFSFDGEISNVAIYNSALISSQVSTLFNFGTPETNISFNPISWWKLNNTTTGIQDSGSASNNGTNNGATDATTSVAVVPSWKIPTALTIPSINYAKAGSFNGTSSKIVTTEENLGTTNTISFWHKRPTGMGSNKVVIGGNTLNRFDGTIILNSFQLAIGFPTDKALYFTDNIFSAGVNASGVNIPYEDVWVHYCITRNGTTQSDIKLYVNSYLVTSSKAEYFGAVDYTTNTTILNLGAASAQSIFSEGELSNISTFSSAFTQAQVSTLYNNGQPSADISSLSPVNWWKLDTIGATITDNGSAGNNGTNTDVTAATTDVKTSDLNIPVNGVSTTLPSTALQQSDLQFDSPYSNFSLSFDGSGDYIDCTDNDMFSFGNGTTDSPFSISTWVNFIDVTNSMILSKHTTGQFEYSFLVMSNDKLIFQLNSQLGTSLISRYYNTPITGYEGQWIHLVGTYDGSRSASGIKIYLNGTRVDDTDFISGTYLAMNNGTAPVEIGRRSTDYMNGKIDETSIFNTELTSSQVLEIYNNSRPKDLTTFSGTAPISWWRLGENAFFAGNVFTTPNSISGAPNGIGSGTVNTMISADAPGTYANGIGTNLDILDRVGDATLSTSNSQSYNIIPSDISPYVPQYVGKQIANNFSMSFDGNDDYFATSSNIGISGNQSRTMSVWLKGGTANNSKGWPMAVAFGAGSNAKAMWIGGGPSTGVYWTFGWWGTIEDIYTNIRIDADNDWHLLTSTYDGTTAKGYIDGVEVASAARTINTTDSTLLIGKHLQAATYWTGEIDEIAIWDTALSAGQIYNDIYQPTATATNKTADLVNNPNLPNPVAWYRMGD